jgi:spermidine/putrescine transport system ATP-binding protein
MNRGRVEQVGGPREVYEHPQTAFVADFIGSLNTLDLRADEIVGEYALVRLGDAERVVVPVSSSARAGDRIRVAVRPERVRVSGPGAPGDGSGSRLEGTVAEVVYLGMVTQFHVDTSAGRIVSNRLADESLEPYAVGARVVLSWEPEHTAALGEG